MTSSISDFYEGKNILVFGSTTFPGKVLLEKLLRSCPNIDKIYCPIQALNNKTSNLSPTDTFAEIYTTKLFDRVRQNNSKFQEKILPFNINSLLSSTLNDDEHEDIYKNLQNTIDICFYIANNSVDFKEQNLKNMIESNVIHLKSILSFLKTCTKLKSIAYLSSIYANIGRDFFYLY
jgi:fatty acyl-CoA reductase